MGKISKFYKRKYVLLRNRKKIVKGKVSEKFLRNKC